MMQLGIFDLNDRLDQLSKIGDPLEVLNEKIDWSSFDDIWLQSPYAGGQKEQACRNVIVTPANVHDSNIYGKLLENDRNTSKDVWADSGYVGSSDPLPEGYREHVCKKGFRNKPLTKFQEQCNVKKSRVRYSFLTISSFVLALIGWSCQHPKEANLPKVTQNEESGGAMFLNAKKAITAENDITLLEYTYSAHPRGGHFEYRFERPKDGGQPEFSFESREHEDYGTMVMAVDESFVTELNELCRRYEVHKWDGFHGIDRDILDGVDFRLNIRLKNGETISVFGSNSFPKNYSPFIDEFKKLVEPVREKLLAAGRERKIARGISGKLESFIVNFKQQGQAGSDSYEFNFYQDRDGNFQARWNVRQLGNDFGGPLTASYSGPYKDGTQLFAKVNALILKHNLIKWDDYKQSAADYNNAEWFQLALKISDVNLNARGTEPPEGYALFREEFLRLMLEEIGGK